MLTKTKLLSVVVAVTTATLAVPALAQSVYTDRAAFLAAVSSPSVTTFNDITSDTAVGTGNTIQGYTFTGATAVPSQIDVPVGQFGAGSGIDGTSFFNITGLAPNATFSIGLGSAVSAFGFDTYNYDFNNDRAEVFVGSQSLGLTPATNGQKGFLGFVAAPASTFSTVSIVSRAVPGDYLFNGFDNFTKATALTVSSAVPEPASWAMMIGGIGMAGGSLRRRKSKVTTRVAFA